MTSGPDASAIPELRYAGAAERLGQMLDRPVTLVGDEADTAWLVNSARAAALFGYPRVALEQMTVWVADLLAWEIPSLDKPTHFDVRDGTF